MNENLGNDKDRYNKEFIERGQEVADMAEIMRYNAYKRNKKKAEAEETKTDDKTNAVDSNQSKAVFGGKSYIEREEKEDTSSADDTTYEHINVSQSSVIDTNGDDEVSDNITSETREEKLDDTGVEQTNVYGNDLDNASKHKHDKHADKDKSKKATSSAIGDTEPKAKKGKKGKVLIAILLLIVLALGGGMVYFLNSANSTVIMVQHKNVDMTMSLQCQVIGSDSDIKVNGKDKEDKSFKGGQNRTEKFEISEINRIGSTGVVTLFFSFTNNSSDAIKLDIAKGGDNDDNFKILFYYKHQGEANATQLAYYVAGGKYYASEADMQAGENAMDNFAISELLSIAGGKTLNMRVELSVYDTAKDAVCAYNFQLELYK